jgi:RHS repeat-associated protein
MFYDTCTSCYSYDRNGNITHIWRIEDLALEDFSIWYCGNQRTSMGAGYIDDEREETYGDLGYYDAFTGNNRSSSANPGFAYDANGAMTQDACKGFTMGYNTLGMPMAVNVPAILGTINYKYLATGEKLETGYQWHSGLSLNPVENTGKPQYTSPNSSLTRQYIGNKVYENGTLKRILLGNGYISSGNYCFYLRDHLGNNCRVANANGGTVQGTYYHPFGKTIGNGESYNESFQPYKYGGKEEEQMHGMGIYDFVARQLDEMAPVFLRVDPLCEGYYSISPYAYCLNNPVRFVDSGGMSTHTDSSGHVIAVYNNDDMGVYKHNISADTYDGSELTANGGTRMGETEY